MGSSLLPIDFVIDSMLRQGQKENATQNPTFIDAGTTQGGSKFGIKVGKNAVGKGEKEEQSLVSLPMAGTSFLKPPCLPQRREAVTYSTSSARVSPRNEGKVSRNENLQCFPDGELHTHFFSL